MKVIQEPVFVHGDERGLVFEPIAFEPLSRQRNLHVVVTLPGFIRGNHGHRHSTETVTVLGPALVRFRENETIQDVRLAEGEAVRFVFPPGAPHAIQNTGDSPNLLIAFADSVHEPDAPDVFREVLIES